MPYKDKDEQREAWNAWYKRNRERENAKAYALRSARRKKLRIRVREIKAAAKCGRCGFDNPLALHFHHDGDDKEITICKAIRDGWPWHKIEKEIKKCTVLCANCHTIEHMTEEEEY